MAQDTTLTAEQTQELARLKSWMPFRVVWGAINPDNGEFECGANHTKRQANERARKGWTVFIFGSAR